MLKTASPVLHGWNDYKIVKPEIKDYPNDSRRSDPCWVLFVDGRIKSAWFTANKNGVRGSFGFKEQLISRWAYQTPPPLPEDFKPHEIDYEKL